MPHNCTAVLRLPRSLPAQGPTLGAQRRACTRLSCSSGSRASVPGPQATAMHRLLARSAASAGERKSCEATRGSAVIACTAGTWAAAMADMNLQSSMSG